MNDKEQLKKARENIERFFFTSSEGYILDTNQIVLLRDARDILSSLIGDRCMPNKPIC